MQLSLPTSLSFSLSLFPLSLPFYFPGTRRALTAFTSFSEGGGFESITFCISPGVFFWYPVELHICGCEFVELDIYGYALDSVAFVSVRVCVSVCLCVCVSVCLLLCVCAYTTVCMSSGVVSWCSVALYIYMWVGGSLFSVSQGLSVCLSLCVGAYGTACKSSGVFFWYSVGLCIYECEFDVLSLVSSRVYRVAKTHRIPYLCRSFSAKEPYI